MKGIVAGERKRERETSGSPGYAEVLRRREYQRRQSRCDEDCSDSDFTYCIPRRNHLEDPPDRLVHASIDSIFAPKISVSKKIQRGRSREDHSVVPRFLSSTVPPDKRNGDLSNGNVRVSGSSKDSEASLPDKRVTREGR